MAKDTDEVEKLEGPEIPGGNEPAEREQQEHTEKETPKDVRGALRAAIKETAEKDADREDDDKSDKSNKRSDVSTKPSKKTTDSSKSESLESDEKTNASKRSDKKEKTEDSEGEVSPEKSEKEEILEPIGYWKTKGKASWDKLDKDTQQAILNREQEVSQGFNQISQRLKSLEEVEKVLAPRAQTIQQFGVSQAQIVDRLFQWMEALGHPNPTVKSQAFKNLAQNFGLDLNQFAPSQQQDSNQNQNNTEIDANKPPQWAQEFAQQVQGEVGTLKQTIDAQKQAAADAFVANWARDKKYYSQVNQLMGQLLQSGAVPMKDGQLDLDGAYEAAVKINPQVAAQIQQEAAEKTREAAKAKAAADAKTRAEKLASAKRAGSGIKPGAPFTPVNDPSKLNGKNKIVSVRDSLKAALDEARE